MNPAAAQSRLRLVRADDRTAAGWADDRRARRDVVRANRAAAGNGTLDPRDPCWQLAVRTSASLQGSMLTPERRTRIMRTARTLGVRPFDASLVIAIVQDQARRRGTLAEAAPTLALLDTPGRRDDARRRTRRRWLLALAAALAADLALAWWLLG